jgi:hypothetical protein
MGAFFGKLQVLERPITPLSEGGDSEIPKSKSPSPKERGAFYAHYL